LGADFVRVRRPPANTLPNAILARNQTLMLENQGGVASTGYFDGILGLGVKATDETAMLKKGSNSLLANFGLDAFCFEMAFKQGRLKLGGELPGYRFSYHNVISSTYWASALKAACIGNKCSKGSKSIALIDSGTSLIYLPSKAVAMLNKVIKLSADCSNAKTRPDVSFLMPNVDGGVTKVKLPAKHYVIKEKWIDASRSAGGNSTADSDDAANDATTGPVAPPMLGKSGDCRTVFEGSDIMTSQGPLTILGMAFIRAHTTSFKRATSGAKARMGIARTDVPKDVAASTALQPDSSENEDDEVDDWEPQETDLSKAILPFRGASLSSRPQRGLSDRSMVSAAANGPPAEVISASDSHLADTGDQFDWWLSID
jgi:hypothetical protein